MQIIALSALILKIVGSKIKIIRAACGTISGFSNWPCRDVSFNQTPALHLNVKFSPSSKHVSSLCKHHFTKLSFRQTSKIRKLFVYHSSLAFESRWTSLLRFGLMLQLFFIFRAICTQDTFKCRCKEEGNHNHNLAFPVCLRMQFSPNKKTVGSQVKSDYLSYCR